MKLTTVRQLGCILFLICIGVIQALSQTVKPNPEERPRQVKPEPTKAYVKWITDVDPILTNSERDAWRRLQTDDEREQFITIFWRLRDPDPDTEENEFKDQFYERNAYADEHFSSGKPGRLSDRGRIYIKFGAPDEIESHPAGGQYERTSAEGGGSTTTYPFERWFYRHIPGVSSGVELEFVDPTGSGEYRLARNPDEKDALIQIPGAGPTLGEIYGFETRAERTAGLGGFGRASYQRAQDSPFEVLTLHHDLEQAQPAARRTPGGILIDTPTADDTALTLETQFNYFRQSDGSVLVAFALQTDNNDLVFSDSGGLQTARLNIFGRITSIADKIAGKFEDNVSTVATPAELSEVKGRKSAYGRAFILQPGRYRLDLLVRDITSGATGIRHIGFDVPRFPSDRLSASSVVLAAKLESMKPGPAIDQFTIGTTKVLPSLSGVFHLNQPVGIYLQVYNAAIDQTTLRPAADVEYVLLKDGKELGKQLEDWRQINDAGRRLTLTRFINTQTLAPGDYQLQVRIHDQITGERLTKSATFTIVR